MGHLRQELEEMQRDFDDSLLKPLLPPSYVLPSINENSSNGSSRYLSTSTNREVMDRSTSPLPTEVKYFTK